MERIAENKRTRSPFLDLGNLGLTEVPEEVFECVWVEFLSFGTWAFVPRKKSKYTLKGVPPSFYKKQTTTKKTSIPGYDTYFTFISKNDSKKIQVQWSFSKNDIEINNINDIPKKLNKLDKLIGLVFDSNKLLRINPEFVIENKFIDLSNNKIFYLDKKAFISNIKLTWELHPPFDNFLFNMHGTIGWSGTLNQPGIVLVNENPLMSPPLEIFKKGEKAIDAYFQSIAGDSPTLLEFFSESEFDSEREKDYKKRVLIELNKRLKVEKESPKPLNQLKTLLVGDGLSGKTSLLKQILKKEFDAGEPQTHGINIYPKDIEIAGESIHVKFWDFGGQEIMHGTHTFFYSKRSIYLLVLDARREGKEDYWLKHIESFGGDSPVLVVLNKLDENPSFDVNRAFLQNKYPNIVGFVRVSCKTGEGIDRLVQELEKQIHALEMRRTPFAKSWFEVKEALDTMGKDYITYEDYYALCHEKEVTDETAQNVLLQFLHDLGIVLAFRNLELHDTQVINPLWLTNAVYRIINSKLVAGKKGYLHLSDLEGILNDPTYAHEGFKYPRNKFLYIVKIMQEFELCYRIAEDVFIVPDLLTVEEQPVPGFGYDTALRFVLQYDFLPASVLPRFMVQLHTRIVEGEQWRTGTALEDPIFKSKAVVKADRDEKRLYLWVNGADRDNRRNFFNFIRKTLHDIHDSFEKLTVTELVPVPGHDDIFIEYAEMVGYEEMGLADYPVGKLRRKFNVEEMLSGLEAPERRQPRRHAPVKVFVSYSHKDAEYKDELVTALAYLSRMEEIELWQDGRIEAGMEWRKEIFEKLAEAEIVICLVSSNFIASDFCYSEELKQALEGHDREEKIVIPIEIKTCAWKKLKPLGEIQGVPSKPISQFAEHSDGWGEIFNQMEGAVKSVRERRGH